MSLGFRLGSGRALLGGLRTPRGLGDQPLGGIAFLAPEGLLRRGSFKVGDQLGLALARGLDFALERLDALLLIRRRGSECLDLRAQTVKVAVLRSQSVEFRFKGIGACRSLAELMDLGTQAFCLVGPWANGIDLFSQPLRFRRDFAQGDNLAFESARLLGAVAQRIEFRVEPLGVGEPLAERVQFGREVLGASAEVVGFGLQAIGEGGAFAQVVRLQTELVGLIRAIPERGDLGSERLKLGVSIRLRGARRRRLWRSSRRLALLPHTPEAGELRLNVLDDAQHVVFRSGVRMADGRRAPVGWP
ncbi:MAG: hypothetical protein DYG93_01485 [Leptolyngbya sp. PLA2]|nr:hypothetical protein [Leptolyngbya sp. PL-A2]